MICLIRLTITRTVSAEPAGLQKQGMPSHLLPVKTRPWCAPSNWSFGKKWNAASWTGLTIQNQDRRTILSSPGRRVNHSPAGDRKMQGHRGTGQEPMPQRKDTLQNLHRDQRISNPQEQLHAEPGPTDPVQVTD